MKIPLDGVFEFSGRLGYLGPDDLAAQRFAEPFLFEAATRSVADTEIDRADLRFNIVCEKVDVGLIGPDVLKLFQISAPLDCPVLLIIKRAIRLFIFVQGEAFRMGSLLSDRPSGRRALFAPAISRSRIPILKCYPTWGTPSRHIPRFSHRPHSRYKMSQSSERSIAGCAAAIFFGRAGGGAGGRQDNHDARLGPDHARSARRGK